ncbi:MAG: NUDIX hydrolase [Bacteroidota bacterium]
METAAITKRKYVYGILANENKYLILLRPADKKVDSSKWNFVGGKLEPNETLAEAMKREASEEIGVLFENISTIFGNYETDVMDIVVFDIGKVKDIKITLNHEHVEYRWVTIDEALQLPLLPYMVKVFKDIKRRNIDGN